MTFARWQHYTLTRCSKLVYASNECRYTVTWSLHINLLTLCVLSFYLLYGRKSYN